MAGNLSGFCPTSIKNSPHNGHEDINSTTIYTHVERGTLHRMLKDFHPLELADKTVLPFKMKKERKEAHAAAA